MRTIVALIAGAIFGAGLFIGGMTDTNKVQGWLDLFGTWDPTLAFVLGGAIMPMLITWRIAAKKEKAVLGSPMPNPTSTVLDKNLLGGSALFGFGWALVGLCPGPAMAVMGFGGSSAWIFMAALIGGMMAYGGFNAIRQGKAA
ncbi:MAG: DUF6691 family protein [Planktomarina sp.]